MKRIFRPLNPLMEQLENNMKCKLCDRETTVILNIDLKETPVCRECCNVITMQNLKSLIYFDNQKNKDR